MPHIRPVMLIVMDGYGCNPDQTGNAVEAAVTPTLDRLARENPHTQLRASGLAVGLPDGQMGNSEVGHLNLGAGRVVFQDFTRVAQAIEDGSFLENPAFLEACRHVKDRSSTLHVLGLIGSGGVHAHQSHLYAVLDLAAAQGIERLALHAITDGRDTPPTSGIEAMRDIEHRLAELKLGHVATVSGRYYAMDRDGRWDRTELAYRAMVDGQGRRASSGVAAIESSYAEGVTDEFIIPTVIEGKAGPVARVANGDAVIFFNFRTDRPRQLTRAFVQPDFNGFDRGHVLRDLDFVSMTEYAKGLPVRVAFPTEDVAMPLARVLSEHGLTQLHAAETEKYAHVTFFFNGGREEPFPGEDRILVPSPRHVGTYDKKPEMSADEIAAEVVEAMRRRHYDFILVNFANADMVGHTGDMRATITAVETVDRNVARVVDAVIAAGGALIITADHGNAEQMVDDDTGGPLTSHTVRFPVPCILVTGQNAELRGCELRGDGVLADVAPTLLFLLGLTPPAEMTGRNLLQC